eukprot:scaffold33137_cov40-Cyclotella_meneghiniana.AAC.2
MDACAMRWICPDSNYWIFGSSFSIYDVCCESNISIGPPNAIHYTARPSGRGGLLESSHHNKFVGGDEYPSCPSIIKTTRWDGVEMSGIALDWEDFNYVPVDSVCYDTTSNWVPSSPTHSHALMAQT